MHSKALASSCDRVLDICIIGSISDLGKVRSRSLVASFGIRRLRPSHPAHLDRYPLLYDLLQFKAIDEIPVRCQDQTQPCLRLTMS
jgi:hypothetical protein